jgi:hypothetical protein
MRRPEVSGSFLRIRGGCGHKTSKLVCVEEREDNMGGVNRCTFRRSFMSVCVMRWCFQKIWVGIVQKIMSGCVQKIWMMSGCPEDMIRG